jgi:ankyrin repeat protein
LDAAVRQGDLETVKDCVARGAIIETRDWDGPIHKAASAGHLEICRFLVSLDHDLVNELPFYDEVHPDETPLSMALLKGHRDVADFLLENGANVGANETDWDNRWIAPRHMISAALANDLVMIQRLLDLGVAHDARDEHDSTALHWAIAREQPDAARFLFNLWRADQQMEPLAASDITDAMLIEAALLTGATPETLHIMETFWARSLNPWR